MPRRVILIFFIVLYANLAYSKGYPLPGLKVQLERLGYWKPDNE